MCIVNTAPLHPHLALNHIMWPNKTLQAKASMSSFQVTPACNKDLSQVSVCRLFAYKCVNRLSFRSISLEPQKAHEREVSKVSCIGHKNVKSKVTTHSSGIMAIFSWWSEEALWGEILMFLEYLCCYNMYNQWQAN